MRIAIKWKFILGYLLLLVGGLGILDVGGDRILYQRMLEQETNTLYVSLLCMEPCLQNKKQKAETNQPTNLLPLVR